MVKYWYFLSRGRAGEPWDSTTHAPNRNNYETIQLYWLEDFEDLFIPIQINTSQLVHKRKLELFQRI